MKILDSRFRGNGKREFRRVLENKFYNDPKPSPINQDGVCVFILKSHLRHQHFEIHSAIIIRKSGDN